jgi:predicted RNA binding protein YcfA (HicA-like mRNA interferase family)
VGNAKKRIEKLFSKKEAHFTEVKTVLNFLGYKLARVRGSHHIFKDKDGNIIILPVHNNFVKRCYVKEILKKINQSSNEKMFL